MRLTSIKQVLALGLALLAPLSLKAEHELQSSFRIQMPRSLAYGNSPLLESSYSINKKLNLPNLTMESQYPTWSEGITMDIHLQLSPLNIWSFSQPQSFHSSSLSINVNIAKTTTEYTETRESPGSSVTIDLKAQCENIKLELV